MVSANVLFSLTAEFVFVDMTSLRSVRQFVGSFTDRGLPLHVLVNNGERTAADMHVHAGISCVTKCHMSPAAGAMLVPERQTHDGFEHHLGLNYLSHFLLTGLLLPLLKGSGSPGCCSRIINMSSATHYAGELHMEDLNRRSGVTECG